MRIAGSRRLKLFLARSGGVAVVGALFGGALGAGVIRPALMGAALGAVSGAIDFATLGVLIGGAETFLPRTRLGRALERAPFLVTFALKALAYSAVILCVIGGRLGANVISLVAGAEFVEPIRQQVEARLPFGVLAPTAFMATAFFLILQQLRQLVGDRTFLDIVRGRYHKAHTEERFFLFVDVAGSTPLAERIGPAAVHRFLDRVFQSASDPIDDHGGEVYQYVGDEIVITWTLADARGTALPLACYFAIEEALQAIASDFERDFGALPRLRAALHAGPVITGEVGGSRRAIVFHGDVMNTTSRLENATRELQRTFLASEDALQRLDGLAAYSLEDLGFQQLRGRAAPVRVHSVTRR